MDGVCCVRADARRPIEAYAYKYSEETSGWAMIGNDKKLVAMMPRKISITSRTGELVANMCVLVQRMHTRVLTRAQYAA